MPATLVPRRDCSRPVPGVQKRRRKFEGRVPTGRPRKRRTLGLFSTEAEAERAVAAARLAMGLRPYRPLYDAGREDAA